MHITEDASYYFATVQHYWGFATWYRAWKYYDVTMKTIRYKDFNIKDYWQRCFLEQMILILGNINVLTV